MFEINAWRDLPSLFDVKYAELWGEDIEIPERVFFWDKIEIQNQWTLEATHMACGSYGIIHATNVHNINNHEWEQHKAPWYWEEFCATFATQNYNPKIQGSSLQEQLTFAKSKTLIEWYTRLDKKVKYEYQINLAKKRCIYTGSANIDRTKTRKSEDKYAVIGNWPWHIFMLCGYGKKWLIAMNSYWDESYDWGFFYIRWEDVGALFSAYVLFDKKDFRTMPQRKEKIKENIAQKRNLQTLY